MNKNQKLALATGLFCLLIAAGAPGFADETELKAPPAEADDNEAFEAFQKVLGLAASGDRTSALPLMEEAYLEVIRRYPGSYLAQESHWRLVLMYTTEFGPPAFDKAEKLRADFLRLYPDSSLVEMIDRAIGEGYHKNGRWDELLRFHAPAVKEYIRTGRLSRASDMYMYAEAKFNKGDLVEAEKGYKIVIVTHPDSRESASSRQRLEEIGRKKAVTK